MRLKKSLLYCNLGVEKGRSGVADSQQADIQVLRYALKSQGICRPCNYIDGPVERSDTYFLYLTQLYFFERKEFRKLLQKFSLLLKKPSNELGWALRGYSAYLKEDYEDASVSFLEAIVMAPENLDNWLDYAFTLRHLGFHDASLRVIFDTKALIKATLRAPIKTRKTRLMRNLKI